MAKQTKQAKSNGSSPPEGTPVEEGQQALQPSLLQELPVTINMPLQAAEMMLDLCRAGAAQAPNSRGLQNCAVIMSLIEAALQEYARNAAQQQAVQQVVEKIADHPHP